jgi:hypothetical protein
MFWCDNFCEVTVMDIILKMCRLKLIQETESKPEENGKKKKRRKIV